MPAVTRLDWDTDSLKHYVRMFGWLPAAEDQLEVCREEGRPLRYLTFCAAQALDVFLLLQRSVLERDPESNVVLNTYFCERQTQDFTEISDLIGPHDQGFLGDFQEMVLFDDDCETTGRSLGDIETRYEGSLRRKLQLKERHQRFRSVGPFDLLNLDFCGVFFPPSGGVLSPTLRAIRRILEWQAEPGPLDERIGSFTIFLTTHVRAGIANEDAVRELISMVDQNRSAYPDFKAAFDARFEAVSTAEAAATDFVPFYTIALPKVIMGEAFDRGWLARVKFSRIYRRSTYYMLAWVARFERIEGQLEMGHASTPDAAYVDQVSRLAKDAGDVIDPNMDDVTRLAASDLAEVVEYRQRYVQSISPSSHP